MRILLIPDGHRRYAERAHCTYGLACRRGAEAAANIVRDATSHPLVDDLSLFVLASKNFTERSRDSLDLISVALEHFLDIVAHTCLADLHLTVRGSLVRLPENLRRRLERVCSAHTPSPKLGLELLVDYDGFSELHALTTNAIEAASARAYDLIIRTGGAFRLSGAPPVESYSADMYPISVPFPELTFAHLQACIDNCLADAARRERLRRPGQLNPAVQIPDQTRSAGAPSCRPRDPGTST